MSIHLFQNYDSVRYRLLFFSLINLFFLLTLRFKKHEFIYIFHTKV